jgi:Kef-type K+ transport system membrane component KefB
MFMDYKVEFFIVIGSLFLAGLLVELIAQRMRLPRVTLLVMVGFILGPSVLDLFSAPVSSVWFPMVTNIALAMVGFLLGGKLTFAQLQQYGWPVVIISLSVVMATWLVVTLGLTATGAPVILAILLAAIAVATAPSVTADVIGETRSHSAFSKVLLGIVAIDDVWGIMLFSLCLVVAKLMSSSDSVGLIVWEGSWEIIGALLVGGVLGMVMAYVTGRIKAGEPTLIEALGAVFLCVGVALWLKVSFLLACICMGMVVANFAKHHNRPFHAIEGIEWPFMVLFFILGGASLHIQSLMTAGLIGILFIGLRIVGRLAGTWMCRYYLHIGFRQASWLGLALLPQAGVALGIALVAVEYFPEFKDIIIPVALAATVFFELLAPVLTRLALLKVQDW